MIYRMGLGSWYLRTRISIRVVGDRVKEKGLDCLFVKGLLGLENGMKEGLLGL